MFMMLAADVQSTALTSPPRLIEHAAAPSPGQRRPRYVGECKMEADGTIRMFLRIYMQTGGKRIQGHAIQEYRPDDPQYEQILKHIGPMRPGDRRPVPAWPD